MSLGLQSGRCYLSLIRPNVRSPLLAVLQTLIFVIECRARPSLQFVSGCLSQEGEEDSYAYQETDGCQSSPEGR